MVFSIRGNSTVVRICEFPARQTSYRKSLRIGSRFWLPHHCQASRARSRSRNRQR
ncbi:hypothetical protein P3X46_010636 [Hevea brasiliensis]|uniref:Uncharacterized protein n=1 Tax=Hevea brasiliensis TaxID=3981 RepID=A0ABQ9MII1_HEVBR|nr:hypothetical protein P3X46_010636 [Hevea brasiliensis]